MISRDSRTRQCRAHDHLGRDMDTLLALLCDRPKKDHLVAGRASTGYEYQPAGNLSGPQLMQGFIDLGQGTRGRMATDFSCGTHC